MTMDSGSRFGGDSTPRGWTVPSSSVRGSLRGHSRSVLIQGENKRHQQAPDRKARTLVGTWAAAVSVDGECVWPENMKTSFTQKLTEEIHAKAENGGASPEPLS